MVNDFFTKIINLIRISCSPYMFGFVQGHSYLSDEQIGKIRNLVNIYDEEIILAYEKKMSALIGPGYGISCAAGRMAFFSILKALNIGSGDEVILLGFTCSVMPNAVWRTGATPIFADVDDKTFGSTAKSIEKKITTRTKVIVAQHSFGIPCRINEIVELGKKKGIFVVEDCAITLDSSIGGVKVGNFGGAAIFSTDHSKPLNTLIGGFFYTTDNQLYKKVVNIFKALPELNRDHQQRIFDQLLFERTYYTPKNYPRLGWIQLMDALPRKLKPKRKFTFLEGDYNKSVDNNSSLDYPYPAKFPTFLAQLGLIELERWESVKRKRKNILKYYLEITQNSPIAEYLPKIYFDSSVDICPLRFVYSHPNPSAHLKQVSRYLDISWIWFKVPVICCKKGLQDFGYAEGSCKISEQVCSDIVNWPCNIDEQWKDKLLNFFKSVVFK